jgi:hypothetical protein
MTKLLAPLFFVFLLAPIGWGDEKRLAELAKARFETLNKAYDLLFARVQSGRAPLDMLRDVSVQLLQAHRDVNSRRENQLAAHEAHLRRMTEVEKIARQRAKVDAGLTGFLLLAEAHRLEAEYWLEKAKVTMDK